MPMTTYRNILLIEDDYDDRDFFLEVLAGVDAGVKCVTAPNGPVGLELLQKLPPKGTLVFLDLNLPMMRGMEVLQAIRKNRLYKEVPVVVLTTSKNFAEECSRLGANLYLIKPSSEDLFHT